MRNVKLIAMTALMLATTAVPAAAQPKPCIAQLASSVRGDMSSVAADWQSDFLGLDQPAGWYAVHIAQSRTECP